MTRTLKRIIDERQARYDSHIALLKQQQREAMGQLEKDCLREMEEMQEKHRRAMDEKEQSHQREVQALREQPRVSESNDLKPFILDTMRPACRRPTTIGNGDGDRNGDGDGDGEGDRNKLEAAETALREQSIMIRRLESEVKVLKRSAVSGVQLRRELQGKLREMQEMLKQRGE